MRNGKQQGLPATLVRLERRFAAWRKKRSAGTRIPESLWEAAAKAAGEFGVSRTSNTLKVNYYALKKRIEKTAYEKTAYEKTAYEKTAYEKTAGKVSETPDFVQLFPPSSSNCECTIELENSSGSMRIHLQGQSVDLSALSRSFWDSV